MPNDEIKSEKALTLFLWVGLCFIIAATIALIGGLANAQTIEQPVEGIAEPSLIDSKLEFLKEDIIDSREVPVYELDEKTQTPVKTLLKEVQYYYAGEVTPKMIKDEGDYSYTEQIGANSYRIYAAPFIKDGDTYRTLEVATTSLMHWYEQVEMEAKDPISKLWDPLFIETHAQDVLETSGDGQIGCSVAGTPATQTGWRDMTTCDNYDMTNNNGGTMKYQNGPDWTYARAVVGFDTSSLSGTVESAELNLFYSDGSNPGVFYVVPGTPADHTSLAFSDYQSFSRVDDITGNFTDFSQYDQETIDVTLSSAVNIGGDTVFYIIGEKDYNEEDVTPQRFADIFTSETADTTYDPYLEITLGAETGTTTPTGSTTPGILLPMADGLSMMMGVLAGWLLMLLFIYALWPA